MAAARKKPVQQSLAMPIAEGIHLGLPEVHYFAADALGSGDLATLASDPASWWYGSRYNPHRRVRRTKARHLTFGQALHAIVLEGVEAYQQRFVVEPDNDSGRWIRNIIELKKRLAAKGVKNLHGDYNEPRLYALAREHGLADQVWELAMDAYRRAQRGGQRAVTEDEDRRLRQMGELVRAHDDLGPGLQKGLAEVSVFWREADDPDTLLRARFDRLQQGAIIDLKSFANPHGKDPKEATFDAIADHDYDLQIPRYKRARELLPRFLAENRVYSWSPAGEGQRPLKPELEILQAVAAEKAWRWIWIFYQVQSDDDGRERAPVIVPWWIWPDDPMVERAQAVIDRGLANYRKWRTERGITKPWADVHPIGQLNTAHLKRLSYRRATP